MSGAERLFFALFRSRLFRSYTDAFDFHARQFATMSYRSVIALAALVLERNDFLVLALFHTFGSDFRPGYDRAPVGHVFSVGKHQHLAEGRRFARIDIQKIHINRIAFGDAKLSATSLDDCVTHESRKKAAQTSIDEPV